MNNKSAIVIGAAIAASLVAALAYWVILPSQEEFKIQIEKERYDWIEKAGLHENL